MRYSSLISPVFLAAALSAQSAPAAQSPVTVLRHEGLCMSGNIASGKMEYFGIVLPSDRQAFPHGQKLIVPEEVLRRQHRVLSADLSDIARNPKARGGHFDAFLRAQVGELDKALTGIAAHRKTGKPSLPLCGNSLTV